jgi:hypothetical protein
MIMFVHYLTHASGVQETVSRGNTNEDSCVWSRHVERLWEICYILMTVLLSRLSHALCFICYLFLYVCCDCVVIFFFELDIRLLSQHVNKQELNLIAVKYYNRYSGMTVGSEFWKYFSFPLASWLKASDCHQQKATKRDLIYWVAFYLPQT